MSVLAAVAYAVLPVVVHPSHAGAGKRSLHDLSPEEVAARVDAFLAEVRTSTGDGVHGPYHEIDHEGEKVLWFLVTEKGVTPDRLLAVIDGVYLGYRENGYHGWVWHWPYFDCWKANRLADRFEGLGAEWEEEGLWTKAYCQRIVGLGEMERVSVADEYQMATLQTVDAMFRWHSDVDQARALLQQIRERFPDGKYAARAGDLLELEDLRIQLPTSRAEAVPVIDRSGYPRSRWRVRGHYSNHPWPNALQPCGTDRSYWIKDSQEAHATLVRESSRLADARDEKLYVELQGRPLGEVDPEGPLAAYDGLFQIWEIVEIRNARGNDCEAAPAGGDRSGGDPGAIEGSTD